jgi:polyisoprenoid-binding protein YceI
LVTAQEPAQIKLFADKSKSTITYAMDHMLHSWEGTSNEVSSVIVTDKDRNLVHQVAVTVKISSFDSKNANRDSHTMEATDAIKFPSVSFASTSIKQDGNLLQVAGNITFHGVSKPVSFQAVKKIVNNTAEISGGFSINMKDFGISPPTLMGVATDENIKLTFTMVY